MQQQPTGSSRVGGWAQMSGGGQQQQPLAEAQRQRPPANSSTPLSSSSFGASSSSSGASSASGQAAAAMSSAANTDQLSAPLSFASAPGSSPRNSMVAAHGHQQLIELAASVAGSSEAGAAGSQRQQVAAAANQAADDEQQAEENRKLRLQLYVFVLRCISYPFNAKQTNTSGLLHHKHQQVKLRKSQLEQIIALHTRYVRSPNSFNHQQQPQQAASQPQGSGQQNTPTASNSPAAINSNNNPLPHRQLKCNLSQQQLKQLDELYERIHCSFNRKFLQNEKMRLLVESECCSQQDLRELFRQNIEQIFKESQLFKPATCYVMNSSQRQPQQTSDQQQTNNSSYNNHSFSIDSASCNGSSSSSAYGQNSGSCTSQHLQQQQGNNLLTNKEVIINSWLMKFETIIRDDGSGVEGGTSSCLVAPATSGQQLAAAGTGSGLSQLQQQQQPSKEQLYQMFQNILNIKKFEHQLFYNALQLDSSDEQAAAIRRELDGRIARCAELERNKKLMPKFVLKEMESLYLEETRMSVNKLMVNLDSLPVMKGGSSGGGSESRYGLQKFRRYNNSHAMINEKVKRMAGAGSGSGGRAAECSIRVSAADALPKSKHPAASRFLLSSAQMPLWSLTFNGLSKFGKIAAQASLTRDGLVESHPSEPILTKMDVVLTFNIEVIVMEVRGLRHLAPTREIYCTMEIEGSERLQTERVQAKKPLWDTQGDFTTSHPLPVLKIKLYAVNPSMLSLEDKELAKLVLRPTVLSPKTPEWCCMQPASGQQEKLNSGSLGAGGSPLPVGAQASSLSGDQELKIRVVVRMDRPQQLKHCGYLYGIGKSTWRKLKRRYHILIQVSQYTFVMCSYRDKKSKPTEMLQLDGYTVDYIEPPTDLIMEHCSEITANEHHGHSGAGSTTLGLAGMLANRILKQPSGNGGQAQGVDGAGCGAGGASGGAGSDGFAQPEEPSAIRTAAALSDELHSKFYFNVVREGDSVVFACDDEQECFGWVMALYRATGQAHKPTPLRNNSANSSHYIDAAFAYNASASQPTKLAGSCPLGAGAADGSSAGAMGKSAAGGSKSSVDVADQRARKHGMDEFIAADPCKFQHQSLFRYLQNETLRYRLNDQLCSLGWFAPGQVLVLDEYCARYGVRTCFRHLAYLNSLLDFSQRGFFIDHTLLNYGYDFCASHVAGNSGQAHPIGSCQFDLRPDGIGTVTVEERDLFHAIKAKLLKMIERQIANFAYCFPFGKPDGALKAALSLLERVLMKEQQTGNSMLQNEEVRQLIRKCLEQAALNNYTSLSSKANLLPAAPAAPTAGGSTLAGGGGRRSQSPACGDGSSPIGGEAEVAGRLQPRSASSLSSCSVASSQASSSAADQRRYYPNNKQPNLQQDSQQPQQQCLTMVMIINNEHIKPKDKLRYLIRLAELCCEQVEETNEYFSDSFAWHSDLMMDHFELFWSLFSVDVDKILGELAGATSGNVSLQQQQSGGQQQLPAVGLPLAARSALQAGGSGGGSPGQPGGSGGGSQSATAAAAVAALNEHASNREVFALFQLLNDHMRKSPNLECRKFKAYLCDTFKPKLLRYIDIMESIMTRMLFKACEKDGQVNCMLIEQMYTKLEDLQRFVLKQLRWPDDQLAEQLHQRLKLIAYELCDACIQKTQQAFQQTERKSSKWTTTTTSYSSPTEMIQMINLALETRNRSLHLCTFNNFDQMSYHSKIDNLVETALGEMQPGLMAKMIYALDSTLSKLARYDEGNLLAPILSLTYKQGMSSSGRDIGKQYVSFVSNCCDLLRQKIDDELWIVNLLEEWYASQMSIICTWLGERIDRSLHDVQLAALITIMPKIYADMSLQGVAEEKLNLKTYQTIMSRLKMEEAAASAAGNLFEQPSSSIFTSSILSSLTSSSSSSATNSASGQSGAGSMLTGNSSATGAASASNMTAAAANQPSGSGLRNQQNFAQGSRPESTVIQSNRRNQPSNSSFTSSSSSSSQYHDSAAAAGSPPGSAGQEPEGDNIADRALQSATRMFKGFWAS